MSFLSPLWLLGLIPWTAVALYLLWGRRRQQVVPFLDFWIGPVKGPRPRRRMAAPPVSLAAALLATLLAVLAAAGPRVGRAGAGGGAVTVVIDRGASMSARGADDARFVTAARRLADEMRAVPGMRLELVVVPDAAGRAGPSDVSSLPDAVSRLPRTAAPTDAALGAAVARVLAEPGRPLVVVSDKPLSTVPAEAVQVVPELPVRNVGLVYVAARETPAPQVMVRVANGTASATARLDVTTAGVTTSRDIPLPAAGAGPSDTFVDVPRLGDVVAVRLHVEDDFEADDVAWLVREGEWPRVEPRGAVPPGVARMVEVYGRSRPATLASPRVAVVTRVDDLSPGLPGVAVVPASNHVAGEVEVLAHPITRHLQGEFTSLANDAAVAEGPGPGWTPVVRVGGRTVVAVREQPVRQAWVGFDAPGFARRPAFVVLWADLFDWLGGSAGTTFRGQPVRPLGSAWRRVEGSGPASSPEPEAGLWPGLYRREEDGALRGVNALDVRFPPPPDPSPTEWRGQLASALAGMPGGRTRLAPWLLVAAAACATVAAMTWRRRVRHIPHYRPVPDAPHVPGRP